MESRRRARDLRGLVLGLALVGTATAIIGVSRCDATTAVLRDVPDAPASVVAPPVSVPADASSWHGAAIEPETTTVGGDDSFQLLVFPLRVDVARFRIEDLGMTRELEGVLVDREASLVVNAGFFDPNERPEGLVVSGGVVLSTLSDKLGGGVVTVTRSTASLAAAEGFLPAADAELAIQAKPRLVVSGASNLKRDDGRKAERTALCLRDQGRTLEVIVARGDVPGRGPSLTMLADMLVSRGCEGALNLDGGPSTGVAWKGGDERHVLPPRGRVRHAIVAWSLGN
jgi:Phosphodiester glycosidase